MPGTGDSDISDVGELTPEGRVGAAMKAARERRGLSCRALAGKLHMAHSNLSDYENGRRLAPQHILEAYEEHLELPAGQLVELRQPAADAVYGTMRHRRHSGPGSSSETSNATMPSRWPGLRGLRGKGSMVAISRAVALIGIGSVLALAALVTLRHGEARQIETVPPTATQRCELLRQYRVVTAGNVLTSGGDIVATVAAGDLFDARTTYGTPYYAHRYYGVDLRTGVWGYVDSKKLHFVKDACFP